MKENEVEALKAELLPCRKCGSAPRTARVYMTGESNAWCGNCSIFLKVMHGNISESWNYMNQTAGYNAAQLARAEWQGESNLRTVLGELRDWVKKELPHFTHATVAAADTLLGDENAK